MPIRRTKEGMNHLTKPLLFEASPALRDEWDYGKNNNIDPEILSSGSGKKPWWKCSNGHEWQARVSTRANGTGCRACLVSEQARNNPVSSQPEIASQLDDPDFTASELCRSSQTKVWWKCEENHRWQAAVNSRCYGATSGCPYCSGRYPIVGETDLATLRPDLAEQWDDESHDPTQFTLASMQKIRWKCISGHQWITAIHNRTHSRTKGNGCPYCPGSRGKNAKILVGSNDLATLHPEIALELYSTHITAQEVRAYSGKRLEWKCAEGHVWTASVADRVLGTGCKDCSAAQTSKIEGRLRTLVNSKEYLSGTILDHNHKLPIPWRKRKTMSVDIYCEWRGLPVVIEYDGSFWHGQDASLARDLDKTNALLSHDYLVVRIRENSLPLLEIDHPNLMQLNVQYSKDDDKNLESAIEEIESWLNSR